MNDGSIQQPRGRGGGNRREWRGGGGGGDGHGGERNWRRRQECQQAAVSNCSNNNNNSAFTNRPWHHQSQLHNQQQQVQQQQHVQQQNHQQGGRGGGGRGRGTRRRTESGFYQARREEQQSQRSTAADKQKLQQQPESLTTVSDIPGFRLDPVTGKYFRILPDSSGVVGFRVSDVRAEVREAREEEEYQKKMEDETKLTKQQPAAPRSSCSTLSLLRSLSLGGLPSVPLSYHLKREHEMSTMRTASDTPSQIIDVDFLRRDCKVFGAEFVDVTADGERLTGCWAQGYHTGRQFSCAASVRVAVNGNECAEEVRRNGGVSRWLSIQPPTVDNTFDIIAEAIVDVAVAPTDSDVTCLLYATAHLTEDKRSGRITTRCSVDTYPIFERTQYGHNVSASPIYNFHKRFWSDNLYSCAWSSSSMRIALGLERHAEIRDVLCDRSFKVSTNQKNVLSSAFNKSGDTLFMGLCRERASMKDLRVSHALPESVYFPDSKNTSWLRPLHKNGHQIVISTLDEKLCLYDIRRPCRPLLTFTGHRSKTSRMPSFVDEDEQFVFAVGSDSHTRVWSLSSGRLLRTFSPPQTTEGLTPSDYPRPVYSSQWGGYTGAAAVLIAAGSQINVYRLGVDGNDLE